MSISDSTEQTKPSSDAAKQLDKPSEPATKPVPREVVVRETVESLAIAFILALIFKAFIAEAFVIPTGSMAPTLMGKHKDVVCKSCDFRYQCGASSEFDQVGRRTDASTVVGTICPLCRKPQTANPFVDKNEDTFSGDRILVSKFAYVWNKPDRWDVIVFKYLYDARLNYIKRCIGLPQETLRIKQGDVYVRKNQNTSADSTNSFEIARKPPHVVNAMLQPVNDTNHIPKDLVKAGLPSYWQPQSDEDQTWTVAWDESGFEATAKNTTNVPSWLRYYHRVIDLASWNHLHDQGHFPTQPIPKSPRIITDFVAYNSSFNLRNVASEATKFADEAEKEIRSGVPNEVFGNDGIHWTGDLAGEFDIEIGSGSKVLSLMIIEAGAKHLVDIDLSTGQAKASIVRDEQKLAIFKSADAFTDEVTASTSLRAGGKYRVKFSNVDDQILLWVNGKVANWSPSNELHWNQVSDGRESGPRSTETDPLDGAPVGIAISEGELKVTRARVSRDIYYIAEGTNNAGSLYDYETVREKLRLSASRSQIEDYAIKTFGQSSRDLPNQVTEAGLYRDYLAQSPQMWGDSLMTTARRSFDFTMEDDWYLPLGDNSAASSDGRLWPDHHTPENLLIGRAIVVFWPHWWNAPIPFMPNFQRMGLIR